MHKWYADDSALKKNHGDSKRPVLLFGGILISREDELSLSALIKAIKGQYTHESMPIKWNMKDLKGVYNRFKRLDEFEKIKHDSANWRMELIKESLQFDYKIFISCIENFQADKKNQKPIKEDLSTYLYANALMRVGLYSANTGIADTQIILDWPEGNQSKHFDKEYWYAYNNGFSSDGQEYYCGPLKSIGFDQTMYYARCNHSNMLQFADIILGATRDWMETELQGRSTSIGKELFKVFRPKFYNYPNILGCGINISSKNGGFKKSVKEMLDG